ncbi:hypothetical protein E3N88_10580 [Mikania micrantha]|uniref:DNA helicase Pif1-like 2B domain-containing protein n=1 Tax=Mikania micrantha TaxID=192012 RepID=A0A5N6PC49_9ASTR|nr:hypothetical protein E3N88_10580 [Mikania micrantha]
MRLTMGNGSSDVERTKLFAKWLLDVGEGNVGGCSDGDVLIDIPDDLVISNSSDPLFDLIDFHLHANFDHNLYSPDVLNGLKLSGLPNHKLQLKVGVPVMLLRNIDQRNGLCNGTRLQIISLGDRVIEAEIISESNIGTRAFITRIPLPPSDKKIPFKFQRRQFPIVVCF